MRACRIAEAYSGGRLLLIGIALALLAAPVDVPAPDGLLDRGYNAMYNLDFSSAHRNFQEWERLHPQDPFGPASDAAAYLFFEFERLKILRSEFFVENHKFFGQKKPVADPRIKSDFESALSRSKQLSATLLQQDPNSERALFANVMRIALHADYLALIDKQYWPALNEIKEARTDGDLLIAKYPNAKDAYLAAGVENYLLSQKAAPLRMFLRMTGAQTDKEAGLAKLRIVAAEGHYLKPYAKILLAIAALRDGKRAEAKAWIGELSRQFPANDLFQTEAARLNCTVNCE